MSAEGSLPRFLTRSAPPKNPLLEQSENGFDTSKNSIHFPPPRTPLNAIPDPSQCRKDLPDSDYDSKDKLEATRGGRLVDRAGTLGLSHGSARVLGRTGKGHSESNSAQSTPARSGSRVSLGGASGAFSGPRTVHNIVGRGPISSRVSRGISLANSEFSMQVPHFELVEDPSFWTDHNVQVLIRLRPLNTMERVSQGYGRCLRQDSAQTLVWLGHPETRFTFDHVACETISQEELFRVAGLPMVENCMSGYNSCMFAYGQTGSGKTYTMMGEIYEMKGKLSEDCGITPRIFEYLFARIKAEENRRRDEKLKYSCKCSFVEIYNEQITDLLDPSSTNLQLREDSNKGVYVENLTEYDVRTVNDVVNLLLQGAANRKMAATHMNSESSRSHSVFTCIIESNWEKDSVTHFRYARLNLVDLAGSERQKSSGAEGDRLKEAANINKSLSTLGLVIMSLVDLAHGKHRHVPYRDSRLTFLLQDSLGGNSKTTIIANVSPSTCSANETLSTLKFAQRAKLIQNNAKVNEDASGDVAALQRQIQQLKGQLSYLIKHHNLSRSLLSYVPSSEESFGFSEECDSSGEMPMIDNCNTQRVKNKKIRCMEATLVGALRREKMAETALQKIEAEVEHMSRLASQREEDVQRTKMMLRFREEKIKRLELLVDGTVSADKYIGEENNALREEIQLLRTKIDRNPELTRFALENIRLIEQLQLYQNFYEQGEREMLLAEVSELRDQLLGALEGELQLSSHNRKNFETVKELEDCRNMNSKLMREVDELQTELRNYLNHTQDFGSSVTFSKDPNEFRRTDQYQLVETLSTRSDTEDDMTSYMQTDDALQQPQRSHFPNNVEETDAALQNKSYQNVGDALSITEKELMDARSLIEALESEQLYLIKELQHMEDENHRYMEILSDQDKVERQCVHKLNSQSQAFDVSEKKNKDLVVENSKGIDGKALQAKLDKLSKDLEKTKLLNSQYEEDQATHLSQQNQVDLVCEQVEMETARTILHLQEEVSSLQVEFQEQLSCMAQENTRLSGIAAKEEEIRAFSGEWDRAIMELTSFIIDGSRSLKDASRHIESITHSFPQGNVWISEHIERAARVCVEKEETILHLQKSLEDAQKMVVEMEQKLSSLKGAAMALNEFQQVEDNEITKETIRLSMLLNEKINAMKILEGKLKCKEDEITEGERRSNAAFLVVKWLSDRLPIANKDDVGRDIMLSELAISPEMGSNLILEANAAAPLEDVEAQVGLVQLEVLGSMKAIDVFYADAEMHIKSLQTDVQKTSSEYGELVQDLVKEVHEMRKSLMEIKNNYKHLQLEGHKVLKCDNHYDMLFQIRDELAKVGDRLYFMEDYISTKAKSFCCPLVDEDSAAEDSWTADSSTSSFDISTESIASRSKLEGSTSECYFQSPEKLTEEILEKGESLNFSDNQDTNSANFLKKSGPDETIFFCLKMELEVAFNAFKKLYVQLATLINDKGIDNCCFTEEMSRVFPSFESRTKEANEGCDNVGELIFDGKCNRTSSFFTKFEEAHATLQEADLMLNALLKENENAKQLTRMWKQAGEDLMVERATLSEEIEQLNSSIHLKDGENEILQEQVDHSLVEIENSMSLFEGSFQIMQKDVEEKLKLINSDVLSMGRDAMYSIHNLRSSLENVYSEILVKGIALFVLFQCHAGKLSEVPTFNSECGNHQSREQVCHSVNDELQTTGKNDVRLTGEKWIEETGQSRWVKNLEEGEAELYHKNLVYENLALKKELERKEVLLEGLLFDFTLLQESASSTKDIKDDTEKLISALNQVRHELEMKTKELDEMLVQYKNLEGHLADTENTLLMSNSDLEQAKEALDALSDQNVELRVLLNDLYTKKTKAEEQWEEQKEVIRSLEKEVLNIYSSVERKMMLSIEDIEDDLRRVTSERDELREEVRSLNDNFEMVYALADENEAIAVEARQESEASKIYAEQKEEEVKILEHSVEELESTINVLEKKVYEMNDEVERHQMMRDSLELELQALRQRLTTVENFTEVVDSENPNVEQINHQMSRKLQNGLVELQEARKQIRLLEDEREEQEREIKQCKEYISELVLHAEAQASQYQQKYKTLEAMVHEVKTDISNSTSAAPTSDNTEKIPVRTRGSSSPFRCIAGLVQQMNLEKDQELSMARRRIEELEALVVCRQKEVCMLNTRLATAESMTHDVIRDLLGVKLDMTNYANLINKHQVQKLLEEAQQQTEDFQAKEQEILNLRKKINELFQERESCISEINKKEADLLSNQMTVEQLRERDQLLTAQNDMLKTDKTNLKRKVAELDEMVKTLLQTHHVQSPYQQTVKMKEKRTKLGDVDLTRRLAHSEKLLSRVNYELAQYHIPSTSSSYQHKRSYGHGPELKNRKKPSFD